jgi:hypothetical protein
VLVALAACSDRKHSPAPQARDASAVRNQATAVAPAWLVDIAPVAPRPELVAHAPVVVGNVVIVAGSKIDYRGLALANGAEAWHRPGGASLAPPIVLSYSNVLLIHDCETAVGAPPGRAVLACFDRIDPIAIAARSAGRIDIDEQELDACRPTEGAWRVFARGPSYLGLARGSCSFDVDPESATATLRSAHQIERPTSEDVVGYFGAFRWRQRIENGKSFVVSDKGGPLFPGIGVLAVADFGKRGAVVVRPDSSLAHDYLAAYDGNTILWTWPLPAPPDPAGRGGPVGLTADAASIFVFFDASRVARFTTPWARPTAP